MLSSFDLYPVAFEDDEGRLMTPNEANDLAYAALEDERPELFDVEQHGSADVEYEVEEFIKNTFREVSRYEFDAMRQYEAEQLAEYTLEDSEMTITALEEIIGYDEVRNTVYEWAYNQITDESVFENRA